MREADSLRRTYPPESALSTECADKPLTNNCISATKLLFVIKGNNEGCFYGSLISIACAARSIKVVLQGRTAAPQVFSTMTIERGTLISTVDWVFQSVRTLSLPFAFNDWLGNYSFSAVWRVVSQNYLFFREIVPGILIRGLFFGAGLPNRLLWCVAHRSKSRRAMKFK